MVGIVMDKEMVIGLLLEEMVFDLLLEEKVELD
jgi:hypothetical protein